jgi:4'-phosphopantetheinyl transferase
VATLDALAGHRPNPIATLDAGERERQARFATEALRRRFALAHDMLRAVIGEFTGLPPRSYGFTAGANGRPKFVPADAQAESRLRSVDFNLSYSGELVACVVTRGRRVGIDIERLDQRIDTRNLERRVLSWTERRRLTALETGERERRFYASWVLKESWAKARGEGLGLPFDAVTLMPDGERLRVDLSAVEGTAQRWRHFRWTLGEEAELALTVERKDEQTPGLRWILDGVPVPRVAGRS